MYLMFILKKLLWIAAKEFIRFKFPGVQTIFTSSRPYHWHLWLENQQVERKQKITFV